MRVNGLDIGRGSARADKGWMHKLVMSLLESDNDELEPLTAMERADLNELLQLIGPSAQTSSSKARTYHQAVLQKLST
jgi:hypothetical protein